MGTAEKFCLRWNDFESNISGAFRELREDKDFFDVTLACDDDQMQAHKVILSACSPFFRTILRRNRHEHPLLYLKGVKYVDLVSVLNFMYHGEVNVAQEELNSFLAVAEDLKVKGLTQNSSDTQKSSSNVPADPPKPRARDRPVQPDPTPPPKRPRPPPQPQVSRAPPTTTYQQEDDDIQEVVPVKSEPLPVPTETPTNHYTTIVEQEYSDNIQQHQEGIIADPNMEYGEEYADYGGYEGYDNSGVGVQEGNKDLDDLMEPHINFDPSLASDKPWHCTQCGKSFKKKCHVKDHIEGSHMVGLSFSCPYCGLEIASRHRMRTHISNKHNSEHKEKQIKISQIPTNYPVIS